MKNLVALAEALGGLTDGINKTVTVTISAGNWVHGRCPPAITLHGPAVCEIATAQGVTPSAWYALETSDAGHESGQRNWVWTVDGVLITGIESIHNAGITLAEAEAQNAADVVKAA